MKYILAFLLFLTVPFYAVAQHNHGGGSRGGSSQVRQPANMHGRGTAPSSHAGLQQRHVGSFQHGVAAQRHWDGRHFDRGYHNQHFGYDHRFGWRGCTWYGSPFVVGSRFWWGGVWFSIYEPIPNYWYDDTVYVEEFDGMYYIYSLQDPGVHFRIGVVF